MKRQTKKVDLCLNCGTKLKKSFEYCPTCGQQNSDRQLSFKQLASDFFANYFSLDSRFGRSIKPFFLQPGRLTKEFMEGKRVKYANPIRLYLVVSLFHFFFFNWNIEQSNDPDKGILTATETESSKGTRDRIITLDEFDTVENDSSDTSSNFLIPDSQWLTIQQMVQDQQNDFTVTDIEDSIRNKENPFFTRYLVRQGIKLFRSDIESINMYLIQNIPLMMFIMLPLYALLLKAFFRKRLYITHLIHSLHLHSFSFILLTVLWILGIFSEFIFDIINPFFFLIIFTYLIISFKNAYQIKFIRSFVSVLLSGFFYSILLIIGLITEVLISLLFY